MEVVAYLQPLQFTHFFQLTHISNKFHFLNLEAINCAIFKEQVSFEEDSSEDMTIIFFMLILNKFFLALIWSEKNKNLG